MKISRQVANGIFWLIMMFAFLNTARAEAITLYAAGSLKTVLSEILSGYEQHHDIRIDSHFAPSGMLYKAIEGGDDVDLFISANMTHPQSLKEQGWGTSVTLLTRNQLCAIAQADIDLTTDNFLETLLRDDIQLGTSTPIHDPSGDYAWQMFDKAENLRPGSFKILSAKAQKLTGGPETQKPPESRNPYAWVMQQQNVDVFLTYCTNAKLAQSELPELQIINLPAALTVGADYGLILQQNASKITQDLATYLRSTEAQSLLSNYGFRPPE